MHAIERFLAACRRQPVDRPPVWIMRQAGRYMETYRALKTRVSFMELCRTPEVATEATMMAVDQLGIDAAIVFSDILIPLEPLGLTVDFDERGPRVDPPVRSAEDIARIDPRGATDHLGFVYDAIGLIQRELAGRLPLLGFAGSPWTLAVYAVEGGTTKNKHAIRRLVYDAPEALHQLLDKLSVLVGDYLVAQIRAGANAVQVFDTWGGILTEAEWQVFSKPYTQRVLQHVRAHSDAPTVHYALEAAHLVPSFGDLACDVLSVDWREPLSSVRARTGDRHAFQGNVEPGVMTASHAAIERAVKACLTDFGRRPGHILNLGHGITPDANVPAARHFVQVAQEAGRRLWETGHVDG
jgi:uroporphyrinogen decarboxylase